MTAVLPRESALAVLDSDLSVTAQDAFRQLTDTIYTVAQAITFRNAETLPGLAELFTDKLLVVVGGNARGPLGYFAGEKWRREEHHFHELHVKVGHLAYAFASPAEQAEDVLDTIAHELAHFYARENDIKDTSGRGIGHGRYHNKNFAMLANALGLRVENSGKSHIGYMTTGLTARGRDLYADLLLDVQDALRLTSVPQPVPRSAASAQTPASPAPAPVTDAGCAQKASKYVFAQCACCDARGRSRTMRMARGWWRPGTVACGICREVFVESQPQVAETHAKGRAS